MQHQSLHGQTILIVQDQPLIATNVMTAFVRVGAAVTKVDTPSKALAHVEHCGTSAVIMDLSLDRSEDGRPLIRYLEQRGIPYVIYSGRIKGNNLTVGKPQIAKAAPPELLVTTVVGLLGRSNPD